MTKSKLDNMTEAYKSTLNELHDIKEHALNWRLTYDKLVVIIEQNDGDGWYTVGTLLDPNLPVPVAEQLSMDGVVAINAMLEVSP